MEKLREVEDAKAIMNEAKTWSVMKWLREKKKVRQTADRANAALDQLSQDVKGRWAEGIRAAYEALVAQGADGAAVHRGRKQVSPAIDLEAKLIAQKMKDADDEVHRSRMDAEKTFDEAERRLSTSLAREGCQKALHGWDLHEKAIRKAETVIRRN